MSLLADFIVVKKISNKFHTVTLTFRIIGELYHIIGEDSMQHHYVMM